MRTERNSSERRKPMSYLSRSKNSALIPRSSVLCIALCAMLFALCLPSDAQQAGKIFRIGFLDQSTASGSAVLVEAFRQELSKLGWIEKKNIAFEYRFAEQKSERLHELAAD